MVGRDFGEGAGDFGSEAVKVLMNVDFNELVFPGLGCCSRFLPAAVLDDMTKSRLKMLHTAKVQLVEIVQKEEGKTLKYRSTKYIN